MIRRVLLLAVILAVLFWVIGAHLAKWRVIGFMDNIDSENVKISYKEAIISGFPLAWKIKLLEPKITIVGRSNVQELLMEDVLFNCNLFSARVIINKKIRYIDSDITSDTNYFIEAANNFIFDLQFNNSIIPLHKPNQHLETLNILHSDLPVIAFLHGTKEIFKLDSVKIAFARENISEAEMINKNDASKEASEKRKQVKDNAGQMEVYKLKLMGNFTSDSEQIKVKKANALLGIQYIVNEEIFTDTNNNAFETREFESDHFERKIDITGLQLKVDDAFIDIKGSLKLSRRAAPVGKFDVNLIQYHNIVDALIPENFIFSQAMIKKAISKANIQDITKQDSGSTNLGNANFKVIFSDQGITIGKFNLLDLQAN